MSDRKTTIKEILNSGMSIEDLKKYSETSMGMDPEDFMDIKNEGKDPEPEDNSDMDEYLDDTFPKDTKPNPNIEAYKQTQKEYGKIHD